MTTAHTYRTLNDYRLVPEANYESDSSGSKLGAGALVAAVFLGLAAYFFYPMLTRNQPAPATNEVPYQAPVATESATPADGLGTDPAIYAPATVTPSPAVPAEAPSPVAPAQDATVNRVAPASKPNAVEQPTQRAAKPAPRSSAATPRESVAPAPATPDFSAPAPATVTPAPVETPETAAEPLTNQSDVPLPATTENEVGTAADGVN